MGVGGSVRRLEVGHQLGVGQARVEGAEHSAQPSHGGTVGVDRGVSHSQVDRQVAVGGPRAARGRVPPAGEGSDPGGAARAAEPPAPERGAAPGGGPLSRSREGRLERQLQLDDRARADGDALDVGEGALQDPHSPGAVADQLGVGVEAAAADAPEILEGLLLERRGAEGGRPAPSRPSLSF